GPAQPEDDGAGGSHGGSLPGRVCLLIAGRPVAGRRLLGTIWSRALGVWYAHTGRSGPCQACPPEPTRSASASGGAVGPRCELMACPLEVPIRLAPAASLPSAASTVRIPPAALTPLPRPTPARLRPTAPRLAP